MKILPLCTQDIISILESRLDYKALNPHFQALLASKNLWGSKWYEEEVKSYIVR